MIYKFNWNKVLWHCGVIEYVTKSKYLYLLQMLIYILDINTDKYIDKNYYYSYYYYYDIH